jgi:hypothetical protein
VRLCMFPFVPFVDYLSFSFLLPLLLSPSSPCLTFFLFSLFFFVTSIDQEKHLIDKQTKDKIDINR